MLVSFNWCISCIFSQFIDFEMDSISNLGREGGTADDAVGTLVEFAELDEKRLNIFVCLLKS
jgi:hypothetical protein